MINLITGCMFAGKTTTAIKMTDEEGSCLYFKPQLDNRYSADDIVTHDNIKRPALKLKNMTDCDNYFLNSKLADCILIDEFQFYEPFIIQALIEANKMGYKVYVTSLNYWADGSKPERLEQLRWICNDKINEIKLKAKCSCGEPAEFTAKMIGSLEQIIEVGGANLYQAKCKKCFRKIRRQQKGVR